MCGIAGIVDPRRATGTDAMVEALRHRGPDASGTRARHPVSLGVARLAIIDPGAGAQPLTDATGRITIAFNGEIYNFQDLRAELQRRGARFATACDTEVVLRAYKVWGLDCLARLRGMFALAIHHDGSLVLARDRYGIKPLHHALVPGQGVFLFASEVKALLRDPRLTPRLDRQSFADWVAFEHLLGTATFFEGIETLPPGHTLTVRWDRGLVVGQPRRYHDRQPRRRCAITLDAAEQALDAVLSDAVALHLTADVEVGLTLSGGLDSSVLALLAAERCGEPLRTFTVADRADHPDAVQARTIATQIGADHRLLLIGKDDYRAAIPAVLAAVEAPAVLSGVPFFLLCRTIGADLKVCLNGEGADELFGGYRDYVDPGVTLDAIAQGFDRLRSAGLTPSERAMGIYEQVAQAPTPDCCLETLFATNLQDQLERHHLEPVDKMAMAASVEMRLPYLDDQVAALVSSLPVGHLVHRDLGIRKYLLRRLALKRFGSRVFDIVLREKKSLPSAGSRLEADFERFCAKRLPANLVGCAPLACCFRRRSDMLLFELFAEIFLDHRGDHAQVGGLEDFIARRRPDALMSLLPDRLTAS